MTTLGPENKIVVPNGLVLWVDVDEVLLNFLRRFNQELVGRGYDIPLDYVPSYYDYDEILGPGKFLSVFTAMTSDWLRELSPFPGADEFTRRLKELGCRVILITSVTGVQLPLRLENLRRAEIYFDEIYATRGLAKSTFVRELIPRYVDSRGRPTKHIIVDDTLSNVLEFLSGVPRSVRGVTMSVPYNLPGLRTHSPKQLAKVNYKATNQKELFDQTLRVVTRLLGRRIK